MIRARSISNSRGTTTMIVGLHFLDVGGELLEAFGVINLRAQRDREMLPAGMLIGVARRQERQEHLVVPAEILGDDVGAAFDIVEDRAVMLLHAARRAAGAAGVDDAGEVVARRRLPSRCSSAADVRRRPRASRPNGGRATQSGAWPVRMSLDRR